MYLLKKIPVPNNQIWAACYMDSATECFEIRTESMTPGVPFALYHKEYPIGTALTDFLYADLKAFSVHLEQIKAHLKEIKAGNDVEQHFCDLLAAAQPGSCAAGGKHPAPVPVF